MSARELVFSLGASYKYHHLKPLFKTLKNTGYKGRFVFFYNDMDAHVVNRLAKFGFELIPFSYEYPYLKDETITQFVTAAPNFQPHPKTLRYILYEAFLKANADQFDKICVCDSRDVVFQNPPFKGLKLDGVHCALEDKSQTICTNYFNSLWIKSAFGNEVLNQIADKPIICSGTTVGTTHNILTYLGQMIETIKVVKDQGCKDQGIHNYLIHSGKVDHVVLHPDDEGPFTTLSSFKEDEMIIIEKGKVLGKNHNVVNILHQYDRYWKLLWKYNRQDYIDRKWNYFKQFCKACLVSRKIKWRYVSNLKIILFGKMVEKFDWS